MENKNLQPLSIEEMKETSGGSFLIGLLVGVVVGIIVATSIQSDGKCDCECE